MSTAARQDTHTSNVTPATARTHRQKPAVDSALLVIIAAQALAEMGVAEPSPALLCPVAEAIADLVGAEPACSHD